MIPASVVALMQGALARTPVIAGALGAAWRPKRRIHPFQAPPFLEVRMGARARPISTARLNASRRLQLRPIHHVFYMGAYRRENSSRRRLPA